MDLRVHLNTLELVTNRSLWTSFCF